MVSLNLQAVTKTVGNNEQWPVLGKINGLLQQFDGRLQDGSSPSAHSDAISYVCRRHVPLIVSGGVAEDHPDSGHISRDAIAGDCAQRLCKQSSIHAARG